MSPRADALILVCLISFVSASFVALPGVAAHAQAGKVHWIGFLREGQPPQSYIDAFQQGLRDRGYVDGQNVVIESRFGSLDQLPQFAEELVRRKVDVIVASAGSAALAAKKATTAVPIVFATVNYPIEIGLVSSLTRPGGNITGTSFNTAELAGKRLELLKELVPTLRRVAVLSHPPYHTNAMQLKEGRLRRAPSACSLSRCRFGAQTTSKRPSTLCAAQTVWCSQTCPFSTLIELVS
jgi:ABC-type uncharacterized transport system substrate-binding protein